MRKIDLVIPFVNSNDPLWRALYQSQIHDSNLNSGRFRDMGSLKYFFRSVEKNLPWINNIFFIVQSRSQVPTWLDKSHPKLRIIYHEDYIPREYLPTFNSITICSMLHLLKDLSENFILADDDMFFINERNPEDFFIDGRPVTKIKFEDNYTKKSGVWNSIIYNTVKLFNEIYGTRRMLHYYDWHLPMNFCKSFILKCWSNPDFGHKIRESILVSKIRCSRNVCEWLFSYAQNYECYSINNENLNTNGYISLRDETEKSEIERICEFSDVVCFNDKLDNNHEKVFSYVTEILERLFPEKSKFELT